MSLYGQYNLLIKACGLSRRKSAQTMLSHIRPNQVALTANSGLSEKQLGWAHHMQQMKFSAPLNKVGWPQLAHFQSVSVKNLLKRQLPDNVQLRGSRSL